jgi:hypothetical protein
VIQPATTLDIRARIAAANASEAERFWAGENVGLLLADRAASFDSFIRELWDRVEWPDAVISLTSRTERAKSRPWTLGPQMLPIPHPLGEQICANPLLIPHQSPTCPEVGGGGRGLH